MVPHVDTVKKEGQSVAQHPEFVFHHPPGHCSWMNYVEQWFGLLQRKRLAIAGKAVLAERFSALGPQWNEHAHPFTWSMKSAAKVMAKCQLSQAA
jgi:hypothetical protein